MFIRKKSKVVGETKKLYYTYQLVKSVRTVNGPRQQILLSIGLNNDLSKVNQKLVAKRIGEIVEGSHLSIIPYPKDVENLAQIFAKQLIAKNAKEMPKKEDEKSTQVVDFEKVDINTLEHSNCRSVGLEHLVLETIKKLKIPSKLEDLKLTKREIEVTIGVVVGRLVQPGSERATYTWMQNQTALGELLECSFDRLSLNQVYAVSDKLLLKKNEIEDHLNAIEDDLFSLDNTIAFFDITNTYLEGSGSKSEKAKRGRSKEKRYDCPLVSLGMVLNSAGFPRKSNIYEGNISEASTLKKIINELREPNQEKLPIVVLDAGIATNDNLEWLREEGFPYIVCARDKPTPPEDLKENYDFIHEKSQNVVKGSLINTDDDTGETHLFCHSTGREDKEKAIQNLFKERFEKELESIKQGLSKKGCTKKYEKVIEKVGRLKQQYSKISRFYKIEVSQEKEGFNASTIDYTCDLDSMTDTYSGGYCLKSWGLDWKAERLWKTYIMLTKVEDGFRALKSDLGMRPIYHQIGKRIDGHIFITLLAYHVLHSILYQLNLKDINLRWDTLRHVMSTQTRVTSSFKNEDNETIHLRSSTLAESEQKEIYKALGFSSTPGRRVKTVIQA